MSKTGKTIVTGIVVLVAIAAFGVYWLASNLDSIVAGAIEKAGTQVTGVPVAVSGVSISLKEGSGEIRGLTVGNPPGFDSDYSLKLGSISMTIDTGSIRSDPVRIKQVSVDGASLVAEVKAGSGINLAKINDQLKSGGGEKAPAEKEAQGPKIVIERFDFTNAHMILKTPVADDRTQKLGDVHLTGIGDGSGGATAAQAASQILAPILKEAVRKARSGAGELGVEGYKQGAVDKLKDKLGIGN
jgi:hypothetical protein